MTGEVVLVPVANPVGLAQRVLGAAASAASISPTAATSTAAFPRLRREPPRCSGRLGADAAANVAAVRAALDEVAARRGAATPAEDLKRTLLRLALPAPTW